MNPSPVLARLARAALLAWLPLAALAQQPAPEAAPQPPAFRLGDAAMPLDYDVHLAIDPSATRFSGAIRIRLRFARATPVLWLDSTGLDVDRVEARQGKRKVEVLVVKGGEDFVGLQAEGAPFDAGEATLTLAYRGPLEPVATRGLFRQEEGGDWYVLSQFEAISARRAFPCFDEPQWKTPWRLTIDAPVADVVTSNMPEESATSLDEPAGWRRHVFERTPPLPSYLVALAVGPFDTVQAGRVGDAATPLGFVVPRGRGAQVAAARESTPALVSILEDYFGTSFPFPKLDMVTIPATVSFGAMENAGMITYQENLVLARPWEDTLAFRRRYASVAAHEMAHQWFGDLVTLAWWDDTWLNEAFATWMSRKVLDRYKPDWTRGWYRGEQRRRALEADRLASARAIRNPVLAKTDIWGAFDDITYEKGGEVLAMFESWLGPERFRAGVRDYLARHAHGSATSADFFDALARASQHPDSARAALEAFIEQPGAPQLDVALRCDGDAPAIEVTQHRFRPVGSNAPEMQWTTPACFRYPAGGTLHAECFEVTNGTHRFALQDAKSCPAWIVGNADGAGDWLPRYDPPLRAEIEEHLAAVPEDEAVAFAGDAALLARSGLLPIGGALELGGALLKHPSPAVQQGGVALLERLPDAWLTRSQLDAKLDLVAHAVVPLATRVGWVGQPGDGEELRELRQALLPFAARYEERDTLRMHARELALDWIARRESVDATMVEPVLRAAGRDADPPMYARLESALFAAKDRHDRLELLLGLSRVRDPALRGHALSLALDDRLGAREAFELLLDALRDDDNREAAFDFVRAHFDALVAKLPPDTPGDLQRPLGELCTPAARSAFADFFAERAPRFLGGPKSYQQALESIDLCIAARK
ncbi:MAG TPA: M1 family metallopeptidase [Usitatibacter sp.]|nr:M1 family metallopeptidase [Usitatibacter sp.]